ncbi:MAG: hypothetical protein JRI25_02615 [Deltaproteobacteria bacterium]|nr:hypothetical protein [Deltaproteobacteria bacterium]
MTAATARAHPNIALVKYWGKRDLVLNLPAVPSLSLTLDRFRTRTTVVWSRQRLPPRGCSPFWSWWIPAARRVG